MLKKIAYGAIFSTVVCLLGVMLYGLYRYRSIKDDNLYTCGYVKMDEVMDNCDYDYAGNLKWYKEKMGVPISVSYDIKNQRCRKNDYYFSLTNPVVINNDEIYVRKDELEPILNVRIELGDDGRYLISDVQTDKWSDCKVIAHAGGGVRMNNVVYTYTNSKEALTQNYSLGTRVFEFDMYPTSDGSLAIVHDWDQFGDLNGRSYSREEWLNHKTGGPNEATGELTTMDIGALLDEMVVNSDIFIVTDTKSFSLSDEEVRKEFEIIYEEAKKRDDELLNRIIPQIYSFEMYDIVKSVYDFPNMIFTTYASDASGVEILSFCTSHDEFKAITAPLLNYGRFGEVEISEMHEKDLKFFLHPVSTYDECVAALNAGADGIYSGTYSQREMEEWIEAQSILESERTE